MTDLRALPLEDRHTEIGARFGEFAGWRMPIWYGSGLEEHLAVRRHAGVFDISHMGRFLITGVAAAPSISSVVTRDVSRIEPGASSYALACNEQGGIVDDLMVYRLEAERFIVIANAANASSIHSLLLEAKSGRETEVEDIGNGRVFLAVQGPESVDTVAQLLGSGLQTIGRRRCAETTSNGERYFIGRTGYTGEDGFEIMTSAQAGGELLARLLALGVKPCGLAARDSLRLEASLPLHGADIDSTTLPWEAGLGWAVELDHEFRGVKALFASKDTVTRQLTCIVGDGQGIFRSHHSVYQGSDVVGQVTSGGFSPMLDRSIAMAYLPPDLAKEGTPLTVDIRGRPVAAHCVKRPFYRSRTSASETKQSGSVV